MKQRVASLNKRLQHWPLASKRHILTSINNVPGMHDLVHMDISAEHEPLLMQQCVYVCTNRWSGSTWKYCSIQRSKQLVVKHLLRRWPLVYQHSGYSAEHTNVKISHWAEIEAYQLFFIWKTRSIGRKTIDFCFDLRYIYIFSILEIYKLKTDVPCSILLSTKSDINVAQLYLIILKQNWCFRIHYHLRISAVSIPKDTIFNQESPTYDRKAETRAHYKHPQCLCLHKIMTT